jgi:hypothetical protein
MLNNGVRVLVYLALGVATLPGAASRDQNRRAVEEARMQPQDVARDSGEAEFADITALLPPAEEAVPLPSGKRIRESVLKQDSVVLAVTPLADVEFTTVRAILPSGRMLLLGEIERFRKTANRTLVYRQPFRLPKGSRIVSEPPVRLELLVDFGSRGR